jgi:hypothetical protein
MKKLLASTFVVLIAGLLLAGGSTPARAEANINFLLGWKMLDEDDWPDANTHGAFGIQTTFGPNKWPVGIAIDAYGSATSQDYVVLEPDLLTAGLTQTSFELGVGVRKIWKSNKARPFIGGGLASINANRDVWIGKVSLNRTDTGPGVWIDGGCFWRLGKKFNIGLNARISRGEVTIEDEDIQAGGLTLGLLLGWGWGGDK